MNKQQTIQAALANAYSYQGYLDLIKTLHKEQKATSFQDNPDFFHYSKLGFSRMKRVYKKLELNENLLEIIRGIDKPQHWLAITESWCGDASQTVPIMARLAAENELVDLQVVLRDSNLDLMEFYHTNGSISIPILVVFDENWQELLVWGPRPAYAQAKVMEYKALPEPKPAYSELSEELQRWYNEDEGKTTQEELLRKLSMES